MYARRRGMGATMTRSAAPAAKSARARLSIPDRVVRSLEAATTTPFPIGIRSPPSSVIPLVGQVPSPHHTRT